ncbi:hypothetical protein V8017_11475 [Stenotrophomonas rhizophila]
MKVWMVLAGAGLVVAATGFLVARDVADAPKAAAVVSEWRPAKQLTLTTSAGMPRSMHLQPDEKAVRVASMSRVDQFDRRWSDAQQIAVRTPRIHLAGPVKDLQLLARESRSIELSDCLEHGREFWTAGLDAEVQAYLSFMAQDRLAGERWQEAAVRDLGNWTKVVDACR